MSRSVLTPEHHAQMNALRQWARQQGNTPPSVLNPKNKQAQAQGDALSTTEATNPSEPTAPDTPPAAPVVDPPGDDSGGTS